MKALPRNRQASSSFTTLSGTSYSKLSGMKPKVKVASYLELKPLSVRETMQRRPPEWPLGSLCHVPFHEPASGAAASAADFAASKSRSNVEQHPARSRSGSTADAFTSASYQAARIFHPIPGVPPTE